MLRRTRILLLSVVLVVGSCGDDDGDGASPVTTSSTSSTATVPSTVAEAGCTSRSGTLRGEPVDAPVRLDADRDELPDDVTVRVVDDATMQVVVDFGAGGRTVETYDDDSVFTIASRVERVVDVDRDGDEDVWVVVGAGASTEVVSLVLAQGCQLIRPDADGAPNAHAVGASVGAVAGVECQDDGFLAHQGENAGESTYRGTSTAWQIEGRSLVRGDTSTWEADATEPGFEPYASLEC